MIRIFFTIIRPFNITIALICCCVFSYITIGTVSFIAPFVSYLLGVACIMGAGYVINDYFDFKTDAVNRPTKIKFKTRNTYLYFYIGLNIAAIFLALFCVQYSHYSLVPYVYSLSIALLWMYSYILQMLPLIGNLTIAFLAVLIYVPLLQKTEINNAAYIFISLSFLITLARELVKDIEDILGDKQAGYKTLPIVFGNLFSQIVAALIIFSAIDILRVSIYQLLIGNTIMLMFYYVLIVFLILSIILLFIKPKPKFNPYSSSSWLLKISIIVFIFIMYLCFQKNY